MVTYDKPIEGIREDLLSVDKYGQAKYSYYTVEEKRHQKLGYMEAIKRIIAFRDELNLSPDANQILIALQAHLFEQINTV